MKDDVENLGLPTRGLNHRLQCSRPAFLPLEHSAANAVVGVPVEVYVIVFCAFAIGLRGLKFGMDNSCG